MYHIISYHIISYHIYITINDSNIIFKTVFDDMIAHNIGPDRVHGWTCSNFYKKDGTIYPTYKNAISSLQETFNNLLFSYSNKLTSTMTSSEALEALKIAKEKLDLGLITQAEYDAKKVELSKFIK